MQDNRYEVKEKNHEPAHTTFKPYRFPPWST